MFPANQPKTLIALNAIYYACLLFKDIPTRVKYSFMLYY